jgi:hypothetical protein
MKVYNEQESAAILKKAAEKSHEASTGESLGSTIQELEQIASASGIDPAQINQAAAELSASETRPDRSFWGGPFSFFSQVDIDHELSAVEWEGMLVLIRDFFRTKGDVIERGSAYEWTSPRGTTNEAHITAVKKNGKTKLAVSWTGPFTAIPFYLPVPLVTLASVPMAVEFFEFGAIQGVSFILLSAMLTFATGRWALRRHMKKGMKKMQALTKALQESPRRELNEPADIHSKTSDDSLMTSSSDSRLELDIEELEEPVLDDVRARKQTR